MKCKILFSGKNKKNISKCPLLKILPRVLRVKDNIYSIHDGHLFEQTINPVSATCLH